MSKKERKAANPHMSKKAKEAAKELKKIEQEMEEAAAEVDEEDRASQVRLHLRQVGPES